MREIDFLPADDPCLRLQRRRIGRSILLFLILTFMVAAIHVAGISRTRQLQAEQADSPLSNLAPVEKTAIEAPETARRLHHLPISDRRIIHGL